MSGISTALEVGVPTVLFIGGYVSSRLLKHSDSEAQTNVREHDQIRTELKDIGKDLSEIKDPLLTGLRRDIDRLMMINEFLQQKSRQL